MDKDINSFFHWADLAIDDFKKLIDASYLNGNAPNFVIARVALVATEPLAKMSFPYNNQGSIPNRFDYISAKPAVLHFYSNFFQQQRYEELAYFIWVIFRNALVHQNSVKKVLNVPIDEIDNSFLAGVHISGSTTGLLEVNTEQRRLEESEHLRFYLQHNQKGIPRPIFRFSPAIYYFDLLEAKERYREALNNSPEYQDRFRDAYPMFHESLRLNFTSEAIRDSERILLLNDIASLMQ